MKTEASTNPDSQTVSTTAPEIMDHLIEPVREAFRSLSLKHRTTIFKKADQGAAKTLRQILHAAHIPASLQPARIGHWLTADQQRKLEALILSTEHAEWLERLLRGFFCTGYKSLNECLLKAIEPKGPAPVSMEAGLELVQAQFSNDPYIALYTATTRWVCRDYLNNPQGLPACDGDATEAQGNPPDNQNAASSSTPVPSSETNAAAAPVVPLTPVLPVVPLTPCAPVVPDTPCAPVVPLTP